MNKTTNINVRIDEQTKKDFLDICEQHTYNHSEILRKLIKNWIAEQKEKGL